MNQLPPIPVTRKSGDEPFCLNGHPLRVSLLNFWQWSSSDLVGNALRGVIAEFIVATAMACNDGTRVEWDAYDLTTPEGIKIEVKSSAYVQSWGQKKLSTINFDIRPTLGWDASTNTSALQPGRQADVYVFCVLHHKDQETVDPLNLDQWTFYVIATEALTAAVGEQKSISLSSLKRLRPLEVAFADLHAAVHQVLGRRQPPAS